MSKVLEILLVKGFLLKSEQFVGGVYVKPLHIPVLSRHPSKRNNAWPMSMAGSRGTRKRGSMV